MRFVHHTKRSANETVTWMWIDCVACSPSRQRKCSRLAPVRAFLQIKTTTSITWSNSVRFDFIRYICVNSYQASCFFLKTCASPVRLCERSLFQSEHLCFSCSASSDADKKQQLSSLGSICQSDLFIMLLSAVVSAKHYGYFTVHCSRCWCRLRYFILS